MSDIPLTGSALNQLIKGLHQDWYVHSLPPEHLIRTFIFDDFDQAMKFVNQVAKLANQEDHHPSIRIYDYKKVDIQLSTHEAMGITSKDVKLAKLIEKQI